MHRDTERGERVVATAAAAAAAEEEQECGDAKGISGGEKARELRSSSRRENGSDGLPGAEFEEGDVEEKNRGRKEG
ncbi:hypothetical protein CVT26_012812 [Gymnopilus dilepis]|uniref:Uncharacterized protein n=1 Tax=Gymnopilus dilepis TaxID=231916 RepID=A0A409Y467_9AGAR|nr:hypothetical protein CVT26_012812 [Gymnopilus dilepis]